VDGVRESHGTGDADYSTDVLRDKAVGIIEGTPAQVPLFLYFAPFAPHGTQLAPDDLLYHGPPRPARRHAGMFSGLANYRPPSFDEANVSDKPAYIRDLPRFTAAQLSQIDAFRRGQYESLQAVDEAAAAIIDALSAQGRLANTIVIFMSDQGVTWGEHRWQTTKFVPYEESIRLPLVIRYDQMTTVRSEGSLVANIDIAPTIADLADVTPATPVEGASLVPFLLGVAPPTWRKNMALEWSEFGDVPGYCGLRGIDGRGRPYMYARYQTGEEELYNMKADPYQLMNSAAGSPLLPQLRVKNESLCDPPPPGYTFP